MKPLPFVLPYAILFWAVWGWAFLPEMGIGIALGSWASSLLLLAATLGVYSYRMAVEERTLLAVVGEPYREFLQGRKRIIPFVCAESIMRLVRSAVSLVLLAGAVTAAARAPRAQEAPRPMPDTTAHFPAVTGRSLTGRTFELPADFEGDLNVVLVAFKRRQQEDVDTWMPFLRGLASRHAGLRVYELPTLSSSYTMMRGFIDGGMRGGIPDATVRAATITLYISKGPYKRALAIPNEDEIQVLLVEPSGRIHWRAAGVFDEATAAGLERAVEAGGR